MMRLPSTTMALGFAIFAMVSPAWTCELNPRPQPPKPTRSGPMKGVAHPQLVGGNAPESSVEPVRTALKSTVRAGVMERMKHCYERSLQRSPDIAARYVIDVTVGSKGPLRASARQLVATSWHRAHGDLSACLARTFEKTDVTVRPECGTLIFRFWLVFVQPS